MKINIKDFVAAKGAKNILEGIDPSFDQIDKKELKKTARDNIAQILVEQEKLYAQGKKSLLVVLQAIDAGGKDSTIRKVMGRINPQGCRVTSFKKPTELELAHDYLWRVHQAVPPKGMIGVFNRSHYEDVLVVPVHDWIDHKECLRRYDHINHFERLLTDQGTVIIKIFLYISKDEQKRRFQERLDIPSKNWKFSLGDLDERALWDKYMKQFEEVFAHTSTDYAPWYIIPANNKRYRDAVVSRILLETMQSMELAYPPAAEGLDKVVIPD